MVHVYCIEKQQSKCQNCCRYSSYFSFLKFDCNIKTKSATVCVRAAQSVKSKQCNTQYVPIFYQVLWVVWFQGCIICNIINPVDDFFFRSGLYKMEQKILENVKIIIEKQDKILILTEKIIKFMEHFQPLIDWVRLFLLRQSRE